MTPAPGRTHQHIVLELGSLLNAHVKARSLGEVYIAPFDVILTNTSIVQPDLDRGPKLQLYARHRVPHYWIVDPVARTVDACTLRAGAYELSVRAEPFPDLEIPLPSL